LANDVVVNPVNVFLALDGGRNVNVLKQELLAVFKDAPDVIHRTAPSLPARLVEPNLVRVHIISAAGGIAQACCGAGITVKLKCTNLIGRSAAWRVNE